MVCALAFGRNEEGSSFAFSQDLVNGTLRILNDTFSGISAGFTPVLPSFYLRCILHLCISDLNKIMLCSCPDLVPFLMEALLLDPDHARQGQGEAIKAAIQRDAAELAMGSKVIKCPSPLSVLKYTHDHSCY
jgi:hypothetical protein